MNRHVRPAGRRHFERWILRGNAFCPPARAKRQKLGDEL